MPRIPKACSALLPVALLLLSACKAPATSPPNDTTLRATPVVARGEAAQAPAQEHSPQPANLPRVDSLDLPSPNGTVPNRDLHGPRDTASYIDRLRSAERLRELKPELVAQNIFDRAGLKADSVIADIGCGPDVFAWPLARLVPGGFIFAVDVEPAQLDALRAGLLERKIDNVVPVLASYSTPHLPPESCDAIFIADTYHHIEDRHAYMTLLRKRLAPGGFLVLLEYKDGDLPVGPPAKHKVPKEERHAELVAAGFELDRELSTHIFHDFEFWRLRRASR